MPSSPKELQKIILSWFDNNGRHDLPWQRNRTAYTVWVSEIMLQQTQVQTVIPYFERFMAHFPTVAELANAAIDDVLALWTGLGYYARARNLHRSAQQIMTQHHGVFPSDIEKLCALPGIGRSTAGAIISQAFDQPAAILDGNVKRVLARLYAVPGWPGHTATQKQLWALSLALVPNKRCRDFTQAMMDLGATVCTSKKPNCGQCPLYSHCRARVEGRVEHYPQRRSKPSKPQRSVIWLLLENTAGELGFEKRPSAGIWGGLYGFPEYQQFDDVHHWLKTQGHQGKSWQVLTPIRHTFTHFYLTIEPIKINQFVFNTAPTHLQWLSIEDALKKGLAAPTRHLLNTLPLTQQQGAFNV